MAKRPPLTVKCFVMFEDKTIEWDEMTEQEEKKLREGWSERLSNVMSDYYTQHPELLSGKKKDVP